ncbi:MAG: hypothetical protein PHF25_09185 [Candidatus Margulisbacteria bacterium]|nr:hypothetical protein [Candidatus Margulisiibacteriota bacterium]
MPVFRKAIPGGAEKIVNGELETTAIFNEEIKTGDKIYIKVINSTTRAYKVNDISTIKNNKTTIAGLGYAIENGNSGQLKKIRIIWG